MTGLVQQLLTRPPVPVRMVFVVLAVALCALVFFVVLRVLTSLLESLGTTVSRVVHGQRAAATESGSADGMGMRSTKVCGNTRCRKVNFRTARFCAQCGARV